MWIKGKHEAVDNQGRRITRDIILNLSQAIGYIQIDEERTRVFFSVGHDLEDHRNASWIDLHEPREKIDRFLVGARTRPAKPGERRTDSNAPCSGS